MDRLKSIVQTFVYIMAGITISTALFITLLIPEATLSVVLLWEIIAMSAVCSLGNFIYYYKAVLNKKQMKYRILCHYLYINVVVFVGAYCWNWISPGLLPEFIVMLILIAAVYAAVMKAIFRQDAKTAENLNRQLRKHYPPKEDDENV